MVEDKKTPAVLKHYTIPSVLPKTDFKAKCNYCSKEITGSTKSTTNWWKHLVSYMYMYIFYLNNISSLLFITEKSSSTSFEKVR